MKRPHDKRELLILVRVTDLKTDGTLHPFKKYHIVRETIRGAKIGACDTSKRAVTEGLAYYTVPFYWWLANNLDEWFCDDCWEALDRLSPPLSNTGVNSGGTGENDDAQ